MNIRYFDPVSGHDTKSLVHILRDIRDMQDSKVPHPRTAKGKDSKPAEKSPGIWHVLGKFDSEIGERITTGTSNLPLLYRTVFGKTLVELVEKNPKIVDITPVMSTGCFMNLLMKATLDRAFDVGIVEGRATTFSGGMVKEGLQPFRNIYSSFI